MKLIWWLDHSFLCTDHPSPISGHEPRLQQDLGKVFLGLKVAVHHNVKPTKAGAQDRNLDAGAMEDAADCLAPHCLLS